LARIDGSQPSGCLLDGRNTAGGTINMRISLTSIDDLDEEVIGSVDGAYQASS
jgi:hypothetical protein